MISVRSCNEHKQEFHHDRDQPSVPWDSPVVGPATIGSNQVWRVRGVGLLWRIQYIKIFTINKNWIGIRLMLSDVSPFLPSYGYLEPENWNDIVWTWLVQTHRDHDNVDTTFQKLSQDIFAPHTLMVMA